MGLRGSVALPCRGRARRLCPTIATGRFIGRLHESRGVNVMLDEEWRAVYFAVQSKGTLCHTSMKALLRTAAVLSFGFFVAAGLVLVGMAWVSHTYEDAVPLGVVGLLLIGTAVFVGPILLFAAELLGRKGEAK
jgi:hypothetical protein